MILNHLAVYCASNNICLPILDAALMYQVFSSYDCYSLQKLESYIKNQHLLHVVMDTFHLFPPPIKNDDGSVIEGKSWLIGYLIITYTANIKASIKGKWKSIINDTIDAHLEMFKLNLSENKKKTWKKNIYKRITCPAPKSGSPERLDQPTLQFIDFHRQGFGVDDDGWVNDSYLNQVVQDTVLITRVSGHFSKCLRRQCIFEDVMGSPNTLKKCTALPQFHIHRVSINIDKKGLYYVLKQYIYDYEPTWILRWTEHTLGFPQYKKWLKILFHITELLPDRSTSKIFKWSGVSITTDGVKASLHYQRLKNQLGEEASHNTDNVDPNDDKVDDVSSQHLDAEGDDDEGSECLMLDEINNISQIMEQQMILDADSLNDNDDSGMFCFDASQICFVHYKLNHTISRIPPFSWDLLQLSTQYQVCGLRSRHQPWKMFHFCQSFKLERMIWLFRMTLDDRI